MSKKTQKLFTSRVNTLDANTYVGEAGRLFYAETESHAIGPSLRYSDGVTVGGLPLNYTSTSVDFGNITTGNITNSDSIYNDNYLFTNGQSLISTITSLDMGNLYIVDETIYGKNLNQDIYITPAGTGNVVVPSLYIPTGSIVNGEALVSFIVANLTLNSTLAFSVSSLDSLHPGDYGIDGGVPAPYTVYQLTTVPTPVLNIGDHISGTGIPYPSNVVAVGTGVYANAIVVDTTISEVLIEARPRPGIDVFVVRDATLASLTISTLANTNIGLHPGINGQIVSGSNIIPTTDSVYDLGSPAQRFRHLWISGGSVFLHDQILGLDQSISARGGNLLIGGAGGLEVGSFIFYANTIALQYPAQDLTIGVIESTGNVRFNRPIKVIDPNNITRFEVNRSGLTSIRTPVSLGFIEAAFSVIGSSSGNVQPRNFGNTLVQLTGMDNQPARFSTDAFGVSGGQNSYAAIAARAARGTVDTPLTSLQGDTLMRLTAQGWTGNGQYAGSIIRVNFETAETFTSNLSTGTRLHVQATPTGSNVIQTSATFYANGIVLGKGGAVSTGITFKDDSFQDTAYVPGENVTSLNIGVGFQQSGVYQGDINIDNAGVLSVVGTPNQITVANVAQNLTLSLPQGINTNSSPTFGNLTITGNLFVTGNVFSSSPITQDSTKIYLGNTSSTSESINTGGIYLGNLNSATSRNFYYTYPADAWNTDGAGLITRTLTADSTYVQYLWVNTAAHFGGDNVINNWPNAEVQIDSNLNDYSQIISQNHNPGTQASTDFVATNDIADGTRYIDLGINSSTYNNALYTIAGSNAGYLYTSFGNLAIGTQTAGNVILFHTGNTTIENLRATISDLGLTVNGKIVSNDGITASSNIAAPNFVGSGRYLTDLYSNANVISFLPTSTVITGINANVSAANLRINSIDANVGNISIYTNSLVGNAQAQASQINIIDANIGTDRIWLSNLQSNVNSINANIGAYHTWANANAASQATSINNINANIGSYYTWANATIATNFYSNANVAAYLPTYTGNVTAGNISDGAGSLRSIPQNSKNTGYTLQSTDNGQMINITTGNVTIPAGVFNSPFGQTVSIYNNQNSSNAVVQGSGVTLRLAGTAATGSRTLARYGVATVICVAANTFVISGAGLS